MGTRSSEKQDVFGDFVNEQPIRLNVKLAKPFPIMAQGVIAILWVERFLIRQAG